MIQHNMPADPVIHIAATKIAERCTDVISGLLRPEEYRAAEYSFYIEARTVLEDIERKKGGAR